MPTRNPSEACKWCGGNGGVVFGICLMCEKRESIRQGLRETAMSPKPINGANPLVTRADIETRRMRAWN